MKKTQDKKSIITIVPKIRHKGFKSENIAINVNSMKYKEILDLLEGSYQENIIDDSFNKNDIKIIKLVIESYKIKISENELLKEHFILNGHELKEIEKIEKKHILRYIVYRYKYNKYPELKIIDKYPPCLQIEPTSICNLRCVMCYQADNSFSNKSTGFMGHMELDLFKKIIDQVEGHVESITFASRGEPFLNKNLIQMLDYCKGKFLALKLNTNATLLNEKKIHALLSSDLQTLVFSIDSAEKGQYEKIRVNADFDSIVANVKLFSDIKRKHYPNSKLILRISGVQINDDQSIKDMSAYWGQYADIVGFTNYLPWEDSYNNPINAILEPCNELWRRMFIWWDGKVNPCDFDYKSVLSHWNINEKGSNVSDIWNSEYYNNLRYVHKEGKRDEIKPCDRCINS